MAILDTLTSELLGGSTVSSISKTAGADNGQVQQLITAALPILMSGMQQNSESKEGAEALAAALDQHAADGKKSTKEQVETADTEDGKKIVQHVLGDNTKDITKGLAKQTGLSSTQVTTILATLAPVLLSSLGSHKTETGTDSSALTGMLGSLLFGNSGTSSSANGLDLGNIASALLGGGSGSSNGSANMATALIGGLLGGGTTGGSNNAGGAAASLLGSLLGGSTTSSSGKKKKDEEENVAGELLGGLMGLLK